MSDNIIAAWKLQRRLKRQRKPIHYFGLNVPVDRTIMPIEVIRQLLVNDYELAEIKAVKALVSSADRVLEIGTGLGIVSSIAARIASEGAVLTFEANPSLETNIRALHRLNLIKNVTPCQGTLRARPRQGVETFHLHKNFPESSLIASEESVGTVEVSARALSDVIAEFRPTVLLCDIEGGEAELLATSDLPGVRVVIVEIHPKVIPIAAIRQIFDNLMGQGFCPRVEHTRDQVVAFERVSTETGPGTG
jgi:FkbM family methyltransferase